MDRTTIPPEWGALPGIDARSGLIRVSYSEKSYSMLLNSFYRSCPEYETVFKAAVEQKDYKQLRQAAHRLYGVAITICAHRLAALCQQLLDFEAEVDFSSITQATEELLEEFSRVIDGLANIDLITSRPS